MKMLHMGAILLVVAGAINWGLVGLFGYNLVYQVFGAMPGVENVIYILVGAAGVYIIFDHKNSCIICGGKGKK